MPSCLGNKELEVFIGGTRIREMYMGNRQVYQYDSVAPTVVVTAPAGTSSGSPAYTTSATYTVSGTITDADSGVAAVYVNGSTATISGNNWSKSVSLSANSSTKIEVYAVDKAGNRTSTITRYACYDSAVPSLSVSAPTGTSTSSPTIITSNSAYSYTVSGSVSDGTGIKSVTVNGSAATISGNNWSAKLSFATGTTHTVTVIATDKAGRTATVKRYLKIESYAQYVSRTGILYNAGTDYAGLTYVKSTNGSSYITMQRDGSSTDPRVYYNGALTKFGSFSKINVSMRYVSTDDTRCALVLEVSNSTGVFTNMSARTGYVATSDIVSVFETYEHPISSSVPYAVIHLGEYGQSAVAYIQKIWLT